MQRAFVHRGEEEEDSCDEVVKIGREKVEAVYEEIGKWLGVRG